MDSTIRLLIADDQEVVRLGLKLMFADSGIEVVAEAATVADAANLALERELDAVLLDVRLSDGDGLAALGRIKIDKPGLPVLIFSAFENPASVARAVALGAAGFLLKDCERSQLVDAIRKVAAGENAWSYDGLRGIRGALKTPHSAGSLEASLTEREAEVLRLMTRGLSNREIAAAMNVGYETIKENVQQLLRKLGLTDRTQAAVWAVRNDLA